MIQEFDVWDQKPWIITKLTAEGKHHPLSRYGQRNEAERYLQFFRRVLPGDTFTLIFEPPQSLTEEELSDRTSTKKHQLRAELVQKLEQ